MKKTKSYGAMEVSLEASKEGEGSQEMSQESDRVPANSPEKVMHKALRFEPVVV